MSLRFLLLVALTCLVGHPLRAQEARIGTAVDTAVVSVGDRITLTVTVDHPTGSQVAWPDSLDLSPFEVLGGQAMGPTPRDDGARSSLILTLTAFELGELEIPSFEVEVIGPAGETTILATNRFGIQVLSVGLDEGGDIREIKGPLGIPVNILPSLLILLAAGMAVILAILLYRRFRKEGPDRIFSAPAEPWRPPQEVALEALDRLEASGLLEAGEVKDYHIRLSDIVRSYVEGRFRVPALEMTTADIIPGLSRAGVEPGTLEGFRTFLTQCDLVKFAKYRPDPDTARSVLALGRRLVEETAPRPGAPDAATAPGTPESAGATHAAASAAATHTPASGTATGTPASAAAPEPLESLEAED